MINTKTKVKGTKVIHIGILETKVGGVIIDDARLGRNCYIHVGNSNLLQNGFYPLTLHETMALAFKKAHRIHDPSMIEKLFGKKNPEVIVTYIRPDGERRSYSLT